MDWPLILSVCIIVIIFPLIIILSFWRYRTIKSLMEHQAMKRSGTVTGSSLLPVLKVPYHELTILVVSVPGSKYRHAKTEASTTLRKPAAADLTIVKESAVIRLGKALGASDVQLGSDEFDREFQIKTTDEFFARNMLNYRLQQKFLEMKPQKLKLALDGTRLAVAVPRVLKTEEGYDQLLDLMMAVMDRFSELSA